MGILQLLAILWARRAVIVGCFITTVALVIGVTLILPKSYRAKLVVLVNHDARDPYTNDFQSQIGLADFLGKQTAIVKSDRTARSVVRALHLDNNARFRREFARNTGGKGNLEDFIAAKLIKNLSVAAVNFSSSIEIAYRATDADSAATIANAFADAYMHTNEDIRAQNARDTSSRLAEQARTLQTELVDAEKRLHDYQEKTGLVVADGDLDSEMKQLDALTKLQIDNNAAIKAAQAQLAAYKDAKASGGPLDELDGVADNQLLRTLRTQIAQLNADLAQVKGRYGTGHPDYTSGIAKKHALEGEIASEIERIGGSLETAVTADQRKEVELQNAIKEQKTRVVQLQSHWDEYGGLANTVKQKRTELARTTQRSGEESIESRVLDVSALVLNPATSPSSPDFPNLYLNTGLAIAFGLVFGLAMSVLVELFDRRIRSADDLEDAAGANVIVVLPKRA